MEAVTFLTSEPPGGDSARDRRDTTGKRAKSTTAASGAGAVRDRVPPVKSWTPTARQLQVLAAVHSSVVARGYPPTYLELSERFGWASRRGAYDHLLALERKGLLDIGRRKARGLRVTCAGLRALGVKVPSRGGFVAERRCSDCGAAFFGIGCPVCGTGASDAG